MKTCGTCGPDGGPCEWMWDFNSERSGCDMFNCSIFSDKQECDPHLAYRQQRERAEAAEARVRDIGVVLEAAAQRVERAEARVAELEGALLAAEKRVAVEALGGLDD